MTGLVTGVTSLGDGLSPLFLSNVTGVTGSSVEVPIRARVSDNYRENASQPVTANKPVTDGQPEDIAGTPFGRYRVRREEGPAASRIAGASTFKGTDPRCAPAPGLAAVRARVAQERAQAAGAR